MAYHLKRRLERLEASAGEDFGTKLRLLSAVLTGVDIERLRAAAAGHEDHLNSVINNDGGITWPGFCFLYGRYQAISSKPANRPLRIPTDNSN